MSSKKNISRRALRKMAYTSDREGIIERYIREKENWDEHLHKSKAYILEAAENMKKGTCLVLGSGWWLDVPTEELASRFDKLIFADITHPAQIKHKARKYPNLELIETDISCYAESLYQAVRKKRPLPEVPENCNFGFPKDFRPDYVVSPNLLSQVGGLMEEFLQKKAHYSEKEINTAVFKLEEAHLKMLARGKSCLIVDYKEEKYDLKTKKTECGNRLEINLPSGENTREWIWDFDLSGNYFTNAQLRFHVRAFRF